jgi:rubrerythrin
MSETKEVISGLKKSLQEELDAAKAYQVRAESADEKTAKLYGHMAGEEYHHSEEIKKRLTELQGRVYTIKRKNPDSETQEVIDAMKKAETVK